MSFRFYTNMLSQASRNVAAGIFTIGLVLIGFGFIIFLLPELFATLAALVFFIGGVGCAVTAVKIFIAQRKLDKFTSEDQDDYRKNVHIHIDDRFEI